MRTWPMERISTWALRLSVLALVLLAPWPFGSVTPRPAALLSASLVALCGLYVTTRFYYRELRPLPVWIWLVGLCGLVLVQQVPLPPGWADVFAPAVGNFYEPLRGITETDRWHSMSAEPFQTLWGLLQLVSFVAAFYMASQLYRHGPERRLVVYSLALLGVALALFGVYQKARFGNVLYGRFQVPSGSPYGPFVNHNHFAGFVEACGLLSLGTALGTARRNPSLALLLGGASGLIGISLVLSHSRGGLIAASAGVVVLAVLSRREESRGHRWIVGGVVVAVALFLAAFAPASLSERLSTLGNPRQDSSIQFRLDLWSDSTGLFADSPVVGTGLGTYASVIPGYRTGIDETRAEFAESDWFQLACETGLLGLFLTIGFLVSVGRLGLHAIVNEPSNRNRGMLLGALAACAALVVHGIYDFNLHIPSNALLFAILLGLLASGDDAASLTWSSRRVFPVFAVVIAVVIVSFTIVASDIGESRRLTREIDPVLTTSDEFTDSIQALVRSRRTVAQNPEAAHLLGRLYNEEAYRSPDAARYREVRLEQAAGAFREAMRLAPARGRYWFELGWTEANRGNDEIADVLFTRAFELEPQQSALRANYASYLASRGRIDEALVQLERGRELHPGIRPLDALNILSPFVSEDSVLLRRAVGAGEEADSALETYRASRDKSGIE